MPHSDVYISVPTWANHHNIWRDANVGIKPYRYYKAETRGLDFEGFLEDLSGGDAVETVCVRSLSACKAVCGDRTLKAAPRGSVFLLHACAHNPTGIFLCKSGNLQHSGGDSFA
eukprot:scaffold188292_cov22-Tisochrysis_lutea.AAC.1